MPVILDDKAIEVQGLDLGTVLQAVGDQLAEQGRIVAEVMIDGKAVVGEELEALAQAPVLAVEVKIVSAEAKALAGEVLGQVRGALAEVRQLQADAADDLQADDPQAAFEKLGGAIEAWLQTHSAIVSCSALMGVDVQALDVQGTAGHAMTERLVASLTELKGLLEDRDPVGLADALAYEWPEVVDQWDQLVVVLADEIAKA